VSSELRQIHFDIGDKLRSVATLATATVINVLPRLTTGEDALEAKLNVLQAAVAEKGLGLVVLPPRLRVSSPNIPGPRTAAVHTIQIIENTLVNRATGGTGVLWEEAMELVLQTLHQWTVTGSVCLTAETDAVEDLPSELLQRGLNGCQVNVTHDHHLAVLSKVSTPTITIASTVTLSCATGSASIYYTIDGTFPYVGNTAATLYAAPFAKPTAGLTVRAAAFKTSLAGSDVAEAVVT
jgi:hypothetical protein